jgi:hypothetical protein
MFTLTIAALVGFYAGVAFMALWSSNGNAGTPSDGETR